MMRMRVGGWVGALVGLILVFAAACGGTGTTEVAESAGETPQAAPAETSSSVVTESPVTETAVTAVTEGESPEIPDGECGQLATMVGMNAPIEAVMFGTTKLYLFFVGYPDLATLEAGGGHFWASEQGGRDDESIIIEPDATGSVSPGAYFIEISGGASAESASFVLTVSTS